MGRARWAATALFQSDLRVVGPFEVERFLSFFKKLLVFIFIYLLNYCLFV
jgi:hypothetical protein